MLSVVSCGGNMVDLWTHDDQSGRQQWKIEPVPNKPDFYTLRIVKGREACNRNYLSTDMGSPLVDLWSEDD